jgi:DNA helicase-2/ATP-dependent DNA helicase PcrA
MNTLLRFPKSMGASGHYGNAFHETIKWAHSALKSTGKLPSISTCSHNFEERLIGKGLSEHDTQLYSERGIYAIGEYFRQLGHTIKSEDAYEFDFAREGSALDNALLTGKVDKMQVNRKTKRITITDFKTGDGFRRWDNTKAKLYKYRQQLYFYKILIERSHSFRGYTVDTGIIQFVEVNSDGEILQLETDFNDDGLDRMKKLIGVVWQHIQALDFPDISGYHKTLNGMRSFENDLLTRIEKHPE